MAIARGAAPPEQNFAREQPRAQPVLPVHAMQALIRVLVVLLLPSVFFQLGRPMPNDQSATTRDIRIRNELDRANDGTYDARRTTERTKEETLLVLYSREKSKYILL